MLAPVADLISARQRPEPADSRLVRGNANRVTGRNGVNTFIGGPVWASAEQQESTDVLFIQLADSRRVDNRLQAARPEDSFRLHVIIKRPDAREVAREDDGMVGVVANDDAPIAYQMDKPAGSPTLVSGTRKRRVAGVSLQRVRQQHNQIGSIIEPSIPGENFGPFKAVVLAV